MRKFSNPLVIIILIISIFTCIQCSDLFEKDISDKQIALLAPSNTMKTQLTTISFMWDSIEDVKKYNIQIVSPDYSLIQNVLIDTTITKSHIQLKNIPIGKYQWRIVGLNGQSKCYSDTVEFTVFDSNSIDTDISGYKIVRRAPAAYTQTTLKTITFMWDSITNIQKYNIQIVTPSYSLIQNVLIDTIITKSRIQFKNIPVGKYQWRIVGLSGQSRCYSDTATFTILDSTKSTTTKRLRNFHEKR